MKEPLMDGKINYYNCTNCDFGGFIPAPFIYHDMENELFVQYYPFEGLDNEEELITLFSPDGKLRIDFGDHPEESIPVYMKDPKVVFSMEELIRYIAFREKLMTLNKSDDEKNEIVVEKEVEEVLKEEDAEKAED
jgi:hypothetical protein